MTRALRRPRRGRAGGGRRRGRRGARGPRRRRRRRRASPARGTVADTDPADWDRVLARQPARRLPDRPRRRSRTCARPAAARSSTSPRSSGSSRRPRTPPPTARRRARVISLTRAMAIDHGARGHPRQLRLPGADRHAAARAVLRRRGRPGGRAPGVRGDAAARAARHAPRRSPARWPTSPHPARARRWAPRSSSMGGTSSDDRPSRRRQRRDRHAGRPLARRGRCSRSSGPGSSRASRCSPRRLHDIGWRSWEACPRLDRRDRPAAELPARRHRPAPRVLRGGHRRGHGARPLRRHARRQAPRRHLPRRYGTQDALSSRARRTPRPRSTSSWAASRSASSRCSASSASPTRSSGATTCCCRSSTGSRCGSARATPPARAAMQIALPDDGELSVEPTAERLRAQPVSARGRPA